MIAVAERKDGVWVGCCPCDRRQWRGECRRQSRPSRHQSRSQVPALYSSRSRASASEAPCGLAAARDGRD